MSSRKYFLALDPGTTDTGVCIIDKTTMKPYFAQKLSNEDTLEVLDKSGVFDVVVIEMIASYGMAVGKAVFETCVWIGRFAQKAKSKGYEVHQLYRKEEKINLCHSMKANDSNIKCALVDRFACHEKNYGKGTKKNPGWFYGFRADVWSAYAVGVTFWDLKKRKELEPVLDCFK